MYFKNQVQGVPEILSNPFKPKTKGIPRLFLTTSKTKQGISKILSNYILQKQNRKFPQDSLKPLQKQNQKGILKILSNYFKNETRNL